MPLALGFDSRGLREDVRTANLVSALPKVIGHWRTFVQKGVSLRDQETEKSRIKQFEIRPVDESALSDVTRFLSRCSGGQGREWSIGPVVEVSCPNIERRLRWLLLENPVAKDQQEYGFCVRDKAGEIRGLNLRFPTVCLAGDRRIRGLGSGGFFVESEAQTLGYFLFKRKLSLHGYSFFFSTTCNSKSALLWEKLGGCAVPSSNVEYVLPLRLEMLLTGLLSRKKSRIAYEKLGRFVGRWANPILHIVERQATELTIESCQDWQKLSALFHRHRSKEWVTTDRSPEYLEWRYGRSSEACPSGVYLVRDRRGNEGWFALGSTLRGRRGEIHGMILLDAVWPREHISPRKLFSAMVRLVDGQADAIFLRPRLGHDYRGCSPWMIRRNLTAPSSFVIIRDRVDFKGSSSLDLVPADGDTALPTSPILRGDQTGKADYCGEVKGEPGFHN